MLEDAGQLGRVALKFVARQGQARQAGNVGYVIFGKGLGHPAIVTTVGDLVRKRYLQKARPRPAGAASARLR
jgi:hypothetical protein